MTKPKLKPCPFCGEEWGEHYEFAPGRIQIQCAACCAEGPLAFRQDWEEAGAAWNCRATDKKGKK